MNCSHIFFNLNSNLESNRNVVRLINPAAKKLVLFLMPVVKKDSQTLGLN